MRPLSPIRLGSPPQALAVRIFAFPALVCFAVACEPTSVAVPLDNPAFRGEDAGDTDAGGALPPSGLSECSLLDATSCGEGQACVPRDSGVRGCVDHAILELGSPCDEADLHCVGGTLCYRDASGARCAEVCDTDQPACTEGRCEAWLDVDGERVGRCVVP